MSTVLKVIVQRGTTIHGLRTILACLAMSR